MAREQVPRINDYRCEHVGNDELPFGFDRVSFTISGVSTAFSNAIRRVVLDELPGYSLGPGVYSLSSTDRYMVAEYVQKRLTLIPLRQDIPPPADLSMSINVVNTTTGIIRVYSRDLIGQPSEPIFNPTFEIARVRPGCSLVIESIGIQTGRGRDFAGFQRVCCAAHEPLDLEPIGSTIEPDSGLPTGADPRDLCGFAKSAMISDPRVHRVSFDVTAVPRGTRAGKDILLAACVDIRNRLRDTLKLLDTRDFVIAETETGAAGTLVIPGETHTIAGILRRIVYETFPEVLAISANVSNSNGTATIVIFHNTAEDVRTIAAQSITAAIDTFETIVESVRKLK